MWQHKHVLVTGGASFIGSHLVDALLERKANVTIVDDFSSGRLSNLQHNLKQTGRNRWTGENLVVSRGDLKNKRFARQSMEDINVVFHLAAAHGGRGYIDTHPAECASNLALDGIVFEEALNAGVDRVCYASSACVYPTNFQNDGHKSERTLLLSEDMADPFVPGRANADMEYGWAKLMGEMALRAYNREHGLGCSSCRIFTAYGERENETHAIIALIAKAFIRMDPYEVWGSGEQDRNFTYVKDIVDGLLLAADKVVDGTAINLGTSEHLKINEVVRRIFQMIGWKPNEITYEKSRPEGVFTRAADLTTAQRLLGWQPQTNFDDGLKRTVDWYVSTKDRTSLEKKFDHLLFER